MAYWGNEPAKSAIKIGDDVILSSHIDDDVIVNADINSSAAIATSKISGALTSVGSHGLATSATTDTTSASNISSGTLAAARVATLNQNTTGSAATVSTAAQTSITSVGTLTGLTVNSAITLGVSGSTNGKISAPEALYFNIDSDGTQTDTEFVWGTNRTGDSGGTEIMRLTESGYLGIGIEPTQPLHVAKSFNGDYAALIHNTHGTGGQGLMIRAGDGADETVLSIRNQASGALATFLADGKVGIGISAPARNLVISSSGQTDVSIVAGTSASAQLQFGDSGDDNIGQIEYNNSDNDMAFYTNATEQMTIASNGNVTFAGEILSSLSGARNLNLNSTHASGGYTEFQTSGSAIGYIGTAKHLVNGSYPNTDFALRSEGVLYLTSGGSGEDVKIEGNGNTTFAGTVSIGSGGSHNSTTANVYADDLVIRGKDDGNGTGITIFSETNEFGAIYFGDGASSNEPYRGYIQYGHVLDQLQLASAGSVILYGGYTTTLTLDASQNSTFAGDVIINGGGDCLFLNGGNPAITMTAAANDYPMIKFHPDNAHSSKKWTLYTHKDSPYIMGFQNAQGLALKLDGTNHNATFYGNLYGSGTGNYLYFNYLRGHGADNLHIDSASGMNIYLGYYIARDIRGASGNVLHSQSDERLKDNVVTLSNSLDKLSAIRGIHYKWKEDTNQAEGLVDDDGNRRLMTGVLAQEVETQFPELVSEGMARIKDEDAEDGWKDEEGYKYVAYDGFIPHLIEAVKELSSENDNLKSRITALENA